MAAYQKSGYGQKAAAPAGKDGAKKSATTHYAYTLKRDGEGNVVGKEYVNTMLLFENEGKFGPILKARITGPIPTDDIFIVRKKASE